MKNTSKDFQVTINESGKASVVQKQMIENAGQMISHVRNDLNQLNNLNDQQGDVLDTLLKQAQQLLETGQVSEENTQSGPVMFERLGERTYESLPMIAMDDDSWESYLSEVESYAAVHKINLLEDPFNRLLTEREQAELVRKIQKDYQMVQANCDKYDYAIAAACGVIAGLIDSFFVGMPGDSKLGIWTDQKVDATVVKFSKMVWRSDRKNGANLKQEPNSIASAIGYLERRFKVNYDARYEKDLHMNGASINMRPSNHHLKSLGHSPDIVGLFFSVLDQFTGKASFISDGQIIRLEPVENKQKFELRGGNFIAKLFAGFANWLGHLMSDVAGSSGTRGHNDGRRGTGIPIPFYSLFQLADFGSIQVNGQKKTFAEFSTAIFEEGYDARFGLTMAIPVAFNELAIRLLWSIKSLFYHKRTWLESLPVGNKPELRRMLLVGHGVMCAVDASDAFLRSTGNTLLFGMRINLIAWSRFGLSALLEVRSLYNKHAIDLIAIEKDIQKEWSRLYNS